MFTGGAIWVLTHVICWLAPVCRLWDISTSLLSNALDVDFVGPRSQPSAPPELPEVLKSEWRFQVGVAQNRPLPPKNNHHKTYGHGPVKIEPIGETLGFSPCVHLPGQAVLG